MNKYFPLINCLRRKKMFYLKTHSTHFIYGYIILSIYKNEIVRKTNITIIIITMISTIIISETNYNRKFRNSLFKCSY